MEEINKTASMATREERVGILAYEIWELEGCPDGKADEHWHLACTIIDAEDAGIAPDLPLWLSRAEIVTLKPEHTTNEKVVPHIKHKSAA